MTRRRNILVLMTDQQRFDSLGCYGNRHALTPRLDRLAAGGARFENCYVQNPICSPSRATFATGLYPRNHGLWANGVTLPGGLPLLSRALAAAGYDCGMVGKQHLAPLAGLDAEPRLDDGYRVYKWSHSPNHPSRHNAYHAWLQRHHPAVYKAAVLDQPRRPVEGNNSSKTALPLDRVPVEAHYSHWIAQEAIDFIEDETRPKETPFYFMANFFDPHHPFGAPDAFRARFDAGELPLPSGSIAELASKPSVLRAYSQRSYAGHAPGFSEYSESELREIVASYYAMVALIDAEVGRILDVLEHRGELEDTLIIFTSDHGEMLGDHALMLKGPMLFEPVVRVPLIIHQPGAVPAGLCIASLVQSIDLTATILSAADVPGAFQTQGSDLMSLVMNPEMPWREWALSEYRDSGHAFSPPVHTTMLRHRNFKLVVWHGEPASSMPREGELYDLEQDPGEHCNLFCDPRYAAVRESLKDLLLDVSVAVEWPRPLRTAQW
jgi:arylsulfatase A-like enzyme